MSVDGGTLLAASARLSEHAATLARSAGRYGSTTVEMQRIRHSIEAHWSGTLVAERSAARVETLAATLDDVAPIIDRRGCAGTLDRLSDTATELGVQLQRLDEEYHALLAERDRMQGMTLDPEALPPDVSGIEARMDENRRTRSRRVQDWLDACATTARSARTAALALEGVAARVAAGGEGHYADNLAPMSHAPMSLGVVAGARNAEDFADSVLFVVGAGQREAEAYQRAWNLLLLRSRIERERVKSLGGPPLKSWSASVRLDLLNLHRDIVTHGSPDKDKKPADGFAAGVGAVAAVAAALNMANVEVVPVARLRRSATRTEGVTDFLDRQRAQLNAWGQEMWERTWDRVWQTAWSLVETYETASGAVPALFGIGDRPQWVVEEPRDINYYLRQYQEDFDSAASPEVRQRHKWSMELGGIIAKEPEDFWQANFHEANEYVTQKRQELSEEEFGEWLSYMELNVPGIAGSLLFILPETTVGNANEALLTARIAELKGKLADLPLWDRRRGHYSRLLDAAEDLMTTVNKARATAPANLLYVNPLDPSQFTLVQGLLEGSCSQIRLFTGTNSDAKKSERYLDTVGLGTGGLAGRVQKDLPIKPHCNGVAVMIFNAGDNPTIGLNPREGVLWSGLGEDSLQEMGDKMSETLYRFSVAHPHARPVDVLHSAGSTAYGWAIEELCRQKAFATEFWETTPPTMVHVASPGVGGNHGKACIDQLEVKPCAYDIINPGDIVPRSPFQGAPAREVLSGIAIPVSRGAGFLRLGHGLKTYIEAQPDLYENIVITAAGGWECYQPPPPNAAEPVVGFGATRGVYALYAAGGYSHEGTR
jgi:hypothetical protein